MKTIRLGFLGCGNIGCGVFRLLEMRRRDIEEREGLRFEVRRILVRDVAKKRNADIPRALLTADPSEIADARDIDVVAEFMGGEQPAASLMARALRSGKTVVTANKMALAGCWEPLFDAARAGGAGLLFEASAGGAVPVVHALTDSLQGSRILGIAGIVNGTTNYILTRMDGGLSYGDALSEAQRLGYAEPDPTADVEGYDAVYKLSILASLAFHRHIPPESVAREGITGVTAADLAEAKRAGEAIKLLAEAEERDGQVFCRVGPRRIPADHPLAGVSGVFNAVFLTGDACGDMMLYGRGAGDLPTAGAVLSDLIRAGHGEIRLPAVRKAG